MFFQCLKTEPEQLVEQILDEIQDIDIEDEVDNDQVSKWAVEHIVDQNQYMESENEVINNQVSKWAVEHSFDEIQGMKSEDKVKLKPFFLFFQHLIRSMRSL